MKSVKIAKFAKVARVQKVEKQKFPSITSFQSQSQFYPQPQMQQVFQPPFARDSKPYIQGPDPRFMYDSSYNFDQPQFPTRIQHEGPTRPQFNTQPAQPNPWHRLSTFNGENDVYRSY